LPSGTLFVSGWMVRERPEERGTGPLFHKLTPAARDPGSAVHAKQSRDGMHPEGKRARLRRPTHTHTHIHTHPLTVHPSSALRETDIYMACSRFPAQDTRTTPITTPITTTIPISS
jgi:hypothetical protein